MLHPASSLRSHLLPRYVVTAAQMTEIESRLFAAGMPVAALMEKVGGLLNQRLQTLYPRDRYLRVGVLAGPGHNGGDALVVARELQLSGYDVRIYQPFSRLKELTAAHARYAVSLGIPLGTDLSSLSSCDWLIDGLFGFGLTRSLEGDIATAIDTLNHWVQPIVSLDLPSGLHTDTGATLGTALQATHTLCLGLWKQAFLQEVAVSTIGQADLVDFGLPLADIQAVLSPTPTVQRITALSATAALPLPRPLTTHKYRQGHSLVIAGSRRYMGAALLAGAAARASGVGMLSIAVPESLHVTVASHLPDALVIGCPETPEGAMAQLPPETDLSSYDAIACGCGLTRGAEAIVRQVLAYDGPLLLDADGLNSLAALGTGPSLQSRSAPTILTPHLGEFKRLFPAVAQSDPALTDRIALTRTAAQQSQAIVLLKGARTVIASPSGAVWLNPDSTPALARGGSGDVLTGLLGGLLAQNAKRSVAIEETVALAAWWHAQAGLQAAQERSELGVAASTLIEMLLPALVALLPSS